VRCGRYWFLSGVCCWKFKQIAKMGFGRKISWAFNVFTLPMAQATLVYLWSKVVYFVSHVDISQTKTQVLHVVILISSETSWWVGVHRLGLRLFGAMVWKLLIIDSFPQSKLNKIKTENFTEICGRSWCFWKAFDKLDLVEFILRFSDRRCERYWFLSRFCWWKFKQFEKN